MRRYTTNRDSNERDLDERRDYRTITRNKYGKDEQHEMVRPIFQYLDRRFKEVIGKVYYDTVSRQTGQTYNHVQELITNGVRSPAFYDVMRLAAAAGTSLDYLASLTALDLYDLDTYDIDRVEDPGHLYFLSDEEAAVIGKYRQLPASTRDATVERFLTTVEETPPPAAQRPKKKRTSSGPATE